MRVSFPQILYDSINGIDCQFEVTHGTNTMVRVFKKALTVAVVVDQPFDVHVIHTQEQTYFMGRRKLCEFDITLADKTYTYHVHNGDVLSISPSENGPSAVIKESYRIFNKKSEDESERVEKVDNVEKAEKVAEV